jgi:hypothetical protein
MYDMLKEMGFEDNQMTVWMKVPDEAKEAIQEEVRRQEEAEDTQGGQEELQGGQGGQEGREGNIAETPIVEIQSKTLVTPLTPSDPSSPSSIPSSSPSILAHIPEGLPQDLKTPQDPPSNLERPIPARVIEDADIIPVVQRTGERFRMPDGNIVEKMSDGSYQLTNARVIIMVLNASMHYEFMNHEYNLICVS